MENFKEPNKTKIVVAKLDKIGRGEITGTRPQLKTVTEISYVLFMDVVREMDLIKHPDAETRGRWRREFVIGWLGEKRANLFFNIYKQIYDQKLEPRFHNVRLMTDNTMQITMKPQDKPKPVNNDQSAKDYLITLAILGSMIGPEKGRNNE